MKYLLSLFCFLLCISASAQLLKTEVHTQLPNHLSLLECKTINAHYSLKTDLKGYAFSIDQLDKMRRGNFIISPKNINKNFTFLELPTIDLNKELRKVMLQVPGKSVIAGPKGFTL